MLARGSYTQGTILAASILMLLVGGFSGVCDAGTVVKVKPKASSLLLKKPVDVVVPTPLVDDSPINPGSVKPDSSKDTSTVRTRSVPRKQGK